MKYWAHLLSVLVVCWLVCENTVHGKPSARASTPNIIIFIADDLGYGDLSSFGHPSQEFGAIDQMANEGLRFSQLYAIAPQCTPSRTALMTGFNAISTKL